MQQTSDMPPTRIADYAAFIPEPLRAALAAAAEPVAAVPGLSIAPGLRARFPDVETDAALSLVVAVHRAVCAELNAVLARRRAVRAFIDRETLPLVEKNRGRAIDDPDYATVIGLRDADGQVVVGPSGAPAPERPKVEVPPWLEGEQITLFGPPDSARMAINAMNALHRIPPDEPRIVASLVEMSSQVPRWGADDEDSQTPLMERLLDASRNLIGCYAGTLSVDTERKAYRLADEGRALPIKRIPGLWLPDGHHLLDGHPLPLHLYDFVSHVWHNRKRPRAMVFYVPKLEDAREAAYVRRLIEVTSAAVRAKDPDCPPWTVKVLCVFENPRAIFRIREIAAALGPHFVGGSLGWHDFLAGAARLFRHDPGYRIPVKADPDIVVNHIKESHLVLSEAMHDIGGLAIGGMYGVLFEDGDPASYAASMVGFVRDVITQMKRGLDGFWVAHPDFVRPGIALVEAWRRVEHGRPDDLEALIRALVPDPAACEPLLDFVRGPDVPGLEPDDPAYPRALLAADIAVSDVIANHDPEEVRYNVFQALQYLASWLDGVGCVALPAALRDAEGRRVAVRIMDDLATTERSRWELWAELHHGRVSRAMFERILAEEITFIQGGDASGDGTRRVHVKWAGPVARWYPIAVRLLRQLVLDPQPVESAPELLLPFTFDVVREADDPWAAACALCPGHFSVDHAGA